MILLVIAVILFFILMEAFFSGSEMGVVSVNRIKMEQLAQRGVGSAVLLKRMLSSPDRLLSTTLIGTNLSVVISSTIFTGLVITTLGEKYTWLTSVVMTPLVLIFGEAIPKALFRCYADTITFHIASVLRFFEIIFWPAVFLVSSISNLLLYPFKSRKEKSLSPFVTREELKLLIRESQGEEKIRPHERAIIHRIFEFGTKKVKEIMVPLKDAVSIDIKEEPLRLKEISRSSGFSRILVYQDNKENIVGFANVFDVLYEAGKYGKIQECLRAVLYISCETPIDEVFYALQVKRMQMAVLTDTSNKHLGIVTFKDLLDEIIGEMK